MRHGRQTGPKVAKEKPMTEESYRELCEKLVALRQQKEQAEGAKSEMLKQLKEKFGVSTAEELESLLAKKRRRQKELEEAAEAGYAKLKRWESKLEG